MGLFVSQLCDFCLKCFILQFLISYHSVSSTILKRVDCLGFLPTDPLSLFTYESQFYNFYKNIAANCTHITNNLVIIAHPYKKVLNNKIIIIPPDLSFLQSIQEVYGYVHILNSYSTNISLPNLRLIRGLITRREDGKRGSLLFTNNFDDNEALALNFVNLSSLKVIAHGDVIFENNPKLCYLSHHIPWKDFFHDQKIQKVHHIGQSFECDRVKCHESCEFCWGPKMEECKIPLRHCEPHCGNHKCYIDTSYVSTTRCCDSECWVGCTGDLSTDCLHCANYKFNNTCVSSCQSSEVPLFQGRHYYAQGSQCVEKCGGQYLLHDNDCVAKCPSFEEKKYYIRDQKCIKCESGSESVPECENNCDVSSLNKSLMSINIPRFTAAPVIQAFVNCSSLSGLFKINEFSNKRSSGKLPDFVFLNSSTIWSLKYLEKIVAKSHDITLVLDSFTDIFNATFLQNIKVIDVRGLTLSSPTIRFLGWKHLERLNVQSLYIKVPNLCYHNNTLKYLKSINSYPSGKIKLELNNSLETCIFKDEICHPECDPEKPCWGPGNDMCTACRNVEANGHCLSSCDNIPGFYLDKTDRLCKPCNDLCSASCFGPHANQCIGKCKKYEYQGECVNKCPFDMYPDKTGVCLQCHSACGNGELKQPYCNDTIALPDGCNFCARILLSNNNIPLHCINSNDCPRKYYPVSNYDNSVPVNQYLTNFYSSHKLGPVKGCKPCHKECEQCFDGNADTCTQCANFTVISDGNKTLCDSACPENTFVFDTIKKICKSCHAECRDGCNGTLASDCHVCRHKKLLTTDSNNAVQFICVDVCPKHLKNFYYDGKNDMCSATILSSSFYLKLGLGVASPLLAILLACIALILMLYYHKEKKLMEKENMELKTKYIGGDSVIAEKQQLLTTQCSVISTKALPNTSRLRIINESELRKDTKQIGCGAFGTVYKAVWVPTINHEDSKSPVQIEVAVKILDDVSNMEVNLELLNEAKVMANVNNAFCMNLLGVCMTAKLQLISCYMPHGSLVNYVRSKKDSIKAKHMMTWVVQISKGMLYLESCGIIHRDLAARNVLVQTPHHVRITDFGLAKMLENNNTEYNAEGGRMAIKWLALECIQYRKFSHKSDVWAFGVTMWEVFTYGAKPYEKIPANQIVKYLEQGSRLNHPDICTFDIYMILIKCWINVPDGRPTFSELTEQLEKMVKEPERFLIIIPCKTARQLSEDVYSLSNDSMKQLWLPDLRVASADAYLNPRSSISSITDDDNISALSHNYQHSPRFFSSRHGSHSPGLLACQNRIMTTLGDYKMKLSPTNEYGNIPESYGPEPRYVEDPLSASNATSRASTPLQYWECKSDQAAYTTTPHIANLMSLNNDNLDNMYYNDNICSVPNTLNA